MPDNYTDPTDSTQPILPPTSHNTSSTQGKLVLGSFNNRPPRRQPYQYPPRQLGPGSYPGERVYTPPNPGEPARQYNQYGQANNPNRPGGPLPRRRRNRGCLRVGCITILLFLVIVIIFGAITIPRVLAFGAAISATKQAPLSTSGDMGTNNRVNLLIMGYGGGTHDGAYLTDSLLVVSLLPQSHHTSLVSIPRDLWVQNPYTTQSKINAIYTVASNNNQNPVDGGKAMTDTVHNVTGLDVNYWMTIDFTGFRELINSIGGIDVYVPDSFSSLYPKNDDPAIDAGWKIITFQKGNQHMDGETAIEYARAREPILDPNQGIVNLAEGTDFARSARQQIIIKAVTSQMKQITTWPKLFNALDALQNTIRTNMSFADLAQFSLDMDLNSSQTAHIGLNTDNVMAYGTSSDGQSIVVPQNNDLGAVANYVQQHLYN